MGNLSSAGKTALHAVVREHGFSEGATLHMLQAVRRGGGGMAQFDHPEFGGSGQWMRGGMVMLSVMFNHELKARVQRLCEDLAERFVVVDTEPAAFQSQHQGGSAWDADEGASLRVAGAPARGRHWWPDELSSPASTGAQNSTRYAWFPKERRLAIDTGVAVTVYDTGTHRIHGFSQSQSGDASMTFTSQDGLVRVADLPIVDGARSGTPAVVHPVRSAAPASAAHAPAAPADPLVLIERLADLKARGVLTDEEFAAKKAELLSRL